MAAEVLAGQGVSVQLFDAMPSVGRKFLLAGRGGLNLTHAEPMEPFVSRYGARADSIAPLLAAFGPQALRDWAHGLGITTFVGSSGRVFPAEMKAAPLLRAWLQRLRAAGVGLHGRHRWLGWTAEGRLRFATPNGEQLWQADAVVLALGGGSWARLGSDGAWVPLLAQRGVAVQTLKPANCGFEAGWSPHFAEHYAGQPLKTLVLSLTDVQGQILRRAGECMLTASGIEGSLIYALAAPIRDVLAAQGEAILYLDLLPDRPADVVAAEVARPRGARSLATHLRSRLNLHGAKMGLLRECLPAEAMHDPARLAAAIKHLPVRLHATRPMDEAISTAGGVAFEALNAQLMLHALPGVFCAGEMLDWEAPTGGYLLTACFASGRVAGQGALDWLTACRAAHSATLSSQTSKPHN